MNAWNSKMLAWQECQQIDTLLSPAICGNPPKAPNALVADGQLGVIGGPILPAITPQAAAYMAAAELRLVPPKPGIGPSPKINPWRIAAVGYPYWLWADGETDPAPVSDTVADLSVSLDAHVQKVVFQMGDGQTVTCRGTGTRWHRGIEPGSESPSCGYRWSEPAPHHTYTVTAKTYWAVDWQAGGETGTISIVQQASTAFPVGELQVVVR